MTLTSIPCNKRNGNSLCGANKAQTIDPRLTGVELVCVTITQHKLLIPYNNRSGTSLCDANEEQTIDPRLTGVELVGVMLTKHKLLIPV